MINVVPLRQPDPATVALLNSLLRQEEAGKIVSLIYSAEVAGDRVQSGYTAIEDSYSAIGQLEQMKVLLLRNLDAMTQEMDSIE